MLDWDTDYNGRFRHPAYWGHAVWLWYSAKLVRDEWLTWSQRSREKAAKEEPRTVEDIPPAQLLNVYMMLAGRALEVWYKGVLVANGRSVPKTHNLVDLAHKAGIACPDDATRALDKLTLYSECFGTYWVSTSRANWPEQLAMGTGIAVPHDLDITKRLVSEAQAAWSRAYDAWRQRHADDV